MMIGVCRLSRLQVLVGALAMVVSCATTPKRSESAASRDKSSASEKVAAQRAAAPPELQLEQDDERWGIEAARERKRQKDEAKTREQAASTSKGVDITPPPAR
jgi:hypothetical protein